MASWRIVHFGEGVGRDLAWGERVIYTTFETLYRVKSSLTHCQLGKESFPAALARF